MSFSLCLTLALLLDVALGDPLKLPHPVAGIGKIIVLCERKLYRDDFKQGLIFCACVVLSTGLIVLILSLLAALINNYVLFALAVYALYAAIAWRSLKDETLPVAISLMQDDLELARYYLSRVVGRDTENASQAEIIRAAVETIAENLIDGVISPLFWAALGYLMFKDIGLIVCVWIFKAASTLDSMIGYDNERYKNFGTASAKLDDILNFMPARIGGVIIIFAGCLLGMNFMNGLKVFIRDRKKHKSPNSAHGESAFAGLLGLKLGGGAYYNKVFEARPWLGEGLEVKEPEPLDILNAHKLMDASAALSAVVMLLIAEL